MNLVNFPSEVESEKVLLGRMMSSINALNDALINLSTQDFYDPKHQLIFRAIKAIYEKDRIVDPIAVASEIEVIAPGHSDVAYLIGLTEYTYSDEALTFIEPIRNTSLKRKYLSLLSTQLAKAQSKGEAFELYAETTKKLDEIFFSNMATNDRDAFEILHGNFMDSGKNWFQWIEQRRKERETGVLKMTGLPTGFDVLDTTLNGLNKSHYIILAGRPGDGKSTFAMNIMFNLMQKGIKVGFFSLEMTSEQVAFQIGSLATQFEKSKLERGEISADHYEVIKSWENSQVFKNLIIDDQDGIKISQLKARGKRMIRNHGVQVIFVDYLGRIDPDEKFSNRQEAIQSVSKGLTNLAKETNLPVFCLAQLNRNSETQNRPPIKADLRESGQIEADAHAILLLHRKDADDKFNQPGVTQLRIAKNRFGAEKNIDFYFLKEFGRFQEAKFGNIADSIREINDE